MDDNDFAVCLDHFQLKNCDDLSKEDLYKTPVGSKDASPMGNESESIEIVETPSNQSLRPLQESTISSASTNNTDICVLTDSHCLPNCSADSESDDGDEVFLRAVDVMDKNEDFTVLHKPVKTRRICTNCDESTEVLMLINSEYHGDRYNRRATYSGTDSDVEVLMSEEIIDSDWSSGNHEEEFKDKHLDLKTAVNECPDEITSPSCIHPETFDEPSLKTQDSTDLDVSGGELIAGPQLLDDNFENLNRSQLLQIIHQQEIRIQALEATVERYHRAQQQLFEHVDALRIELNEIKISPFQKYEKKCD